MSKLIPHVHRDAIIAWANGEKIEFKHIENGKEVWITSEWPAWDPGFEYRVKPKTIKIGNVEVPRPLTPAEVGVGTYYLVGSSQVVGITIDGMWTACAYKQALQDGFVHKTREDAEKHRQAIVKLNLGG